jgi:Holliday junction resolvasome RuvABC endonuclease subunit
VIVLGVDPAFSKPFAWTLLSYSNMNVDYVDSMRGDLQNFDEYLQNFNPSCVAVEDQFFYKNVDTAKKLCWAAGQIMGICTMRHIPYVIVNVAKWKNYWKVTGKGAVYTPQSLVRDMFNRNLSDDAACAALIAYYHIQEGTKREEAKV